MRHIINARVLDGQEYWTEYKYFEKQKLNFGHERHIINTMSIARNINT